MSRLLIGGQSDEVKRLGKKARPQVPAFDRAMRYPNTYSRCLDRGLRIVVESGNRSFGTRDLFLKSIALAQIHWMSLAQFLRYSSDDSSGCKMEDTNPSWPAFFHLLRQTLLK